MHDQIQIIDHLYGLKFKKYVTFCQKMLLETKYSSYLTNNKSVNIRQVRI